MSSGRVDPEDPRVLEAKKHLGRAVVNVEHRRYREALQSVRDGMDALGDLAAREDTESWQLVGIALPVVLGQVAQRVRQVVAPEVAKSILSQADPAPAPTPALVVATVIDPKLDFQRFRYLRGDFDDDMGPEQVARRQAEVQAA